MIPDPHFENQSAGRTVVHLVALIGTTVVATLTTFGWLYWIRTVVASWFGPKLHDVLVLDELPGHDSIPMFVFVITFAVTAVLLGLLPRFLRFDRPTAAVTIGLTIGILCYFADVVSVFVVRQVSFDSSLRAAVSIQSVYLAATIGGLGGTLFGHRPSHGRRQLTYTVVWATAIAGALDLLTRSFPRHVQQTNVVGSITTGLLPPVARTLVVPIGVLLLISAKGLSRHNRYACTVAIGLLFVSSGLQLLRDLDYPISVVSGLVAVLLVARRHEFTAKSDPTSHPRAFGRLTSMIALAFGFGVVVRLVHQLAGDLGINATSILTSSLRGLLGEGGAPHHLGYAGYPWTSLSQLSIVLIGLVWAIGIWTAPWRHLLSSDERMRRRAIEIVRNYGFDTLAPFSLRKDKAHFFHSVPPTEDSEGGTAMLAYRVVRGIAVVSGDPVGPPDCTGPTIAAFLEFAHARGWRVAIMGVSQRRLDCYRSLGLHDLYHGDEAVIDVPTFSLAGGARKSVRQAVQRVAKKGYTAEVCFAGAVSPVVRHELVALDRSWLGNRARKGFVMQLDELFGLSGSDAMFVIGRDPAGDIVGFLHLGVCHASAELSLSSMPRQVETPNGFNAFLIVELVKWAQEENYRAISLNFSPFAGLLDADAELSSIQKMEREALLSVKGLLSLQLDNLLTFNRGFSPRFDGRYCVFERHADLPRVVVAAMAAEGYLPFADWLRGWETDPASTKFTPDAPSILSRRLPNIT